jgi:lipoprotein-releasing system permease protein
VAVAMGISLMATVYPAWRAAKMDPAEALRYD